MTTLPQMIGEPDRRTYIGGSDAAAILGVGAYDRTPYSTYLAKIGEHPESMSEEKKRFLERRRRWEEPIVQMLREEFGGKIVSTNKRYIHPEHAFIASEIDFEWIDERSGNVQNGEIKTVSPFAFGESRGWGEPGTGDIPIHYYAQAMHGMMVTGRDQCVVAAMVGLDSFFFYVINRDSETISSMLSAEIDFWENHVLTKTPPDPISPRDVSLMFSRHNGKPVIADDSMVAMLGRIDGLRQRAAEIDGELSETELELGIAIAKQWGINPPEEPKDDATIIHNGNTVGSWRKTRGTSLDQKLLKEKHPDLVKQFTKEYFYRKFYIKRK